MFFSSIRDSSLAFHWHLSPSLWKYRLESTGKSYIFPSPTRLRNGTGISISAFHRQGEICLCPAALAFMMDSKNPPSYYLPHRFWYDYPLAVHMFWQCDEGKSEGNHSGSWLLVSAAGCWRVFRSVGRQKWKYRFHFWADTTEGKYQIFLTSKGCSPVNKEKAAYTSPANQVGRSRISFCSFYDM